MTTDVGKNIPLFGKYLHIYEICVPRFHTAPLWGFIPIHLPQFVCFALCTMSVVLCPLSNISCFSIAYELMNCPRCPLSSVICPLSSVLCPLSSAICPLHFSLQPLSSSFLHLGSCTLPHRHFVSSILLLGSCIPLLLSSVICPLSSSLCCPP